MNERIYDLRFAICDFNASFPGAGIPDVERELTADDAGIAFSLTPCFSGVLKQFAHQNRFISGFQRPEKTAKAVRAVPTRRSHR
jgi:hypothetical protein